MSRPHSLRILPEFTAEDSAICSHYTHQRGSEAKGVMAASPEESSEAKGKLNNSESDRRCHPYHERQSSQTEERDEEEVMEEEEEEEDLWWLTDEEEEEEEDQDSLCSLPRRRSITQCSPVEKESGCTSLRRALTSFSLRLLHTEKERPVQRILRPPTRRQTMRGLSGLPIEAANQWNERYTSS